MALKNNKIFHIILTGLLLFAGTSKLYPQQDKPAASSGEIQFYLDKAAFYGNKESSFVEFYLMFFADRITFKQNKGELLIDASITYATGKKAAGKEWTLEAELNGKDDNIKTKVLYDQWNHYLKPGKYKISVTVKDVNNSSKKGVLNSELEIPAVQNIAGTLSLSGIEFVTSLDNISNNGSPFVKGNKTVVPNPSRRYGVLNPSLYFYYEINGITKEQGDKLNINYVITDGAGAEVKNESIEINKPGEKAAITHGLDVSKLKTGLYNLTIKINDPANGKTAEASRKFEIIQPDFTSQVNSLTEEGAAVYGKILSYITPEQEDTYNKLNAEGKANFLINSGKAKTPHSAQPITNICRRYKKDSLMQIRISDGLE